MDERLVNAIHTAIEDIMAESDILEDYTLREFADSVARILGRNDLEVYDEAFRQLEEKIDMTEGAMTRDPGHPDHAVLKSLGLKFSGSEPHQPGRKVWYRGCNYSDFFPPNGVVELGDDRAVRRSHIDTLDLVNRRFDFIRDNPIETDDGRFLAETAWLMERANFILSSRPADTVTAAKV